MIGGVFRECLGGFAACGLLRKKLPQSSPLSRPERMPWGCAQVSAILVSSLFVEDAVNPGANIVDDIGQLQFEFST